MNEIIETVFVFVGLLFLIGLFMFSIGNIAAEKDVQKLLSEQGIRFAIFNNLIAAPCTNNNYGDHIELRKLIVDSMQAEEESSTPPLTCVDIGNAKYRIDIKDLETNVRWTFSNYQPVTPRPMSADFEMIIQINTNSTPAKYEYGYILLDEYHKAILTANIELDTSTEKLQNEMFCGEGPECASGNCIKGPGQANATCQDAECTYANFNGDACTRECECASSECPVDTKICTGIPPVKLLLGQPCTEDSDCISGICAINKRCSDHAVFSHVTGKVTDNAGNPIADAVVEMICTVHPELDTLTTTDSDGDYTIQNIELPVDSQIIFAFLRANKPGYNEAIVNIKVTKAQTLQQNIQMTPT